MSSDRILSDRYRRILKADPPALSNTTAATGSEATIALLSGAGWGSTARVLILIINLGNPASSWSQGDLNADGNGNVLGDALLLVINLGFTNGEAQ